MSYDDYRDVKVLLRDYCVEKDIQSVITKKNLKELLRKEYKRGYADAMNWKTQNHLEHLPPAQREWVGLTLDEALEISDFLNLDLPEGWIKLSNAIEAKLKEKNHA